MDLLGTAINNLKLKEISVSTQILMGRIESHCSQTIKINEDIRHNRIRKTVALLKIDKNISTPSPFDPTSKKNTVFRDGLISLTSSQICSIGILSNNAIAQMHNLHEILLNSQPIEVPGSIQLNSDLRIPNLSPLSIGEMVSICIYIYLYVCYLDL
jgi:hypothetical protein